MSSSAAVYRYKRQASQIVLGVLASTTGCVLSLIGASDDTERASIWLAVGGVTIAIGVVCVLTGTAWCWWAVEQARSSDVMACEEELLYGCRAFDDEQAAQTVIAAEPI